MLDTAGYYDGANVQLLEGASLKKYQVLKIIVTDEFVDEYKIKSLDSTNSKYATPSTASQAFKTLLFFQKPGIGSGNYKKDLMEMLEKKYESID